MNLLLIILFLLLSFAVSGNNVRIVGTVKTTVIGIFIKPSTVRTGTTRTNITLK